MTSKHNPFMMIGPPKKDTGQQFSAERRKNTFLPFVDNGLSQIGGKIQGEDDQISDSDTLFKMKDWLQIRDKEFFQENQLNDGQSIKYKKPRSQLISSGNLRPQSPRSEYPKQEMTIEEYMRSADRKSKSRDKVPTKKDCLPLFKLAKQTIVEKQSRKFTVQEFQRYKRLKQAVKQAKSEGHKLIQESIEKYQLQKVVNTCAELDEIIEKQIQLLQNVEKYAILGESHVKSQQNQKDNQNDDSDKKQTQFYQKLQKLQQLTSLLLAKENQYRDEYDNFYHQDSKQAISINEDKQNKHCNNGFMKKSMFSIHERQNDNKNAHKQRITLFKQKQIQRSNKQSLKTNTLSRDTDNNNKSKQKKQRTLIDEYREKLSFQSGYGSRQIQNHHCNQQVEKQYQQRLYKALAPLPTSSKDMKSSMRMGKISMSEFLEMNKQKQARQRVDNLFQSKKLLQQSLRQLKNYQGIKVNYEDNQVYMFQQRPKKLLLGKFKPQKQQMDKLTSICKNLTNPPSLKSLNLLPQNSPNLILIDNPQIIKSKKSPLENHQQKITQLQIQKPLNEVEFKKLSINIFKRVFNNSNTENINEGSKQFSNNQSNNFSQRFGNESQVMQNIPHNNDPIKPSLPPIKQQPQMKMVTSVMMRNQGGKDSQSIKESNTFKNRSRTLRQGMSQRFNRSPGRKSQKVPNTSVKKSNQYTQLMPTLQEQLRMQAIYEFVPQQGMDPEQYYRQNIDMKIQQYVRQKGGNNIKPKHQNKKPKSLYIPKQQRQRLKQQRQKRKKMIQQLKHLQKLYNNNNYSEESEDNGSDVEQWDKMQDFEIQQKIKMIKRQQLLKNKENSFVSLQQQQERQHQILDSSMEQQQRARRFFKIGDNGRAEQININKNQRHKKNNNQQKQQKDWKASLLEFVQQTEEQNRFNKRQLMRYLKRQQKSREREREQQVLKSVNKSNGLILHSRQWGNKNSINNNNNNIYKVQQSYGDRVTFAPDIKKTSTMSKTTEFRQQPQNLNKTTNSQKKQSLSQVLIKKVVSDNEDDNNDGKEYLKYQQREKVQKKDSDKDDRLPTFGNLGIFAVSAEGNGDKDNKKKQEIQQTKQKQQKKSKDNKQKQQQHKQKPPKSPTMGSKSIFSQSSKNSSISIFSKPSKQMAIAPLLKPQQKTTTKQVTNPFAQKQSPVSITTTKETVNNSTKQQQQQQQQQQQKQKQKQKQKQQQQQQQKQKQQQQQKQKQKQPSSTTSTTTPPINTINNTNKKNIFGDVKNTNIFGEQKQQQSKQQPKLQIGKVSNIFITGAGQQQQSLQQPPQFTSFNPQQFQDAFKPKQGSKTFSNFQSLPQQPSGQGNFLQQLGQQIGQQLFGHQNNLQSQSHQGQFQSFGPSAFGMMNAAQQVNQSLQSSTDGNLNNQQQQNQQQQNRNIFAQPNIFTTPSQQQQPSSSIFSGTSSNPMSILHQSLSNQSSGNPFEQIQKQQQQNNGGNLFLRQGESQSQSQQQQQSNQVNIFGRSNTNNSNVFNSRSNSNSTGGTNIFNTSNTNNSQPQNNPFGNIINQQQSNIPTNFMQPRK